MKNGEKPASLSFSDVHTRIFDIGAGKEPFTDTINTEILSFQTSRFYAAPQWEILQPLSKAYSEA